MDRRDPKSVDATVTYDPSVDVATVSYRDVVIASQADADRIRGIIQPALAAFGRRLDLLIDLSGLTVKPSGARAFGEMRKRLIQDHALANVRYGGDAQTKSTVYTSSVIDGVSGRVAATRQEALRELMELRKAREPVKPSSEPIPVVSARGWKGP